MFHICFWQAAAWSPTPAPRSLQLPSFADWDAALVTWHHVHICIPHPSSTICFCSALTWRGGTQIHGGCGMSCRAPLLGLGGQLNPPFLLPIPTLTAAWWRLVSLLPGWFGDLQNTPHSGAKHPQAVSCAVFPHFNYL